MGSVPRRPRFELDLAGHENTAAVLHALDLKINRIRQTRGTEVLKARAGGIYLQAIEPEVGHRHKVSHWPKLLVADTAGRSQ